MATIRVPGVPESSVKEPSDLAYVTACSILNGFREQSIDIRSAAALIESIIEKTRRDTILTRMGETNRELLSAASLLSHRMSVRNTRLVVEARTPLFPEEVQRLSKAVRSFRDSS